jgi:FtsP/CotA-like multicopper oxidase with cupredoxin domain
MSSKLSRRDWFKLGAAAAGLSGVATVLGLRPRGQSNDKVANAPHLQHPGAVGDVSTADFDPVAYLTAFDYGRSSRLSDGRTLRDYDIIATDKEVEVAPGVFFPAWTYNGRVPGPTIRCTEGDWLRVNFTNSGSHPHTIHFHGTHPPEMDGVLPVVDPGESFIYEFDAKPYGLHLYHCHTMPLKRHIHKGLYRAFIIDPAGGRPAAREMVMMMNAFDTNFDGENEVYAVNTVGFHYQKHPIPVRVGETVRVYLINITEFDLVNSFHLHASMFRLYRTGTELGRSELTDTIMMCQGERHILEFELENPGLHMFHAHQSEFAELGWVGFFDAQPQTLATTRRPGASGA